jgi:hypothetical protein
MRAKGKSTEEKFGEIFTNFLFQAACNQELTSSTSE